MSVTSTNTTPSPYGPAYGGTAPENYQRYFVPAIGGPFAADLVNEAALRPGERVLDVACGTGVVTRLAAERVGTGGSVAALDLNPAMLSVARSVPVAGATVAWHEADAESMPFGDASFDVVLSQFGLQFMADQAAAVREMRRVLAPGGRVLLSTPRPNAFFDVLDGAIGRHVGPEAAAFVSMVFSLNDLAALERLFREAGFADVAVRAHTKSLRLPPARDFVWQYIHCTPLTDVLSRLDAGRVTALENDVVQRWQPWSDVGGMRYEQGIALVKARA
jgi:ubiquinone/menaquinone biosynthesis C-methylase UbiE